MSELFDRPYFNNLFYRALKKELFTVAYGGTYLNQEQYKEGFWRGVEYKDMEISHLTNVHSMLLRHYEEQHVLGYQKKADEVKAHIDSRPKAIVSQHEFRITEEMIIAWARKAGVKIPKELGIYTGPRHNQRRVTEMYMRWDTSKEIK